MRSSFGARVELGALVGERQAVLLPGPIEQRDRAMVEQVEEVAQREVLVADAAQQEGRVVMGQHPRGPGQAQERDHHLRERQRLGRRACVPRQRPHLANGAGGKLSDGWARKRTASGPAASWPTRHARACAVGTPALDGQALQQAHGLEEVEAVRLAEQPGAQTRTLLAHRAAAIGASSPRGPGRSRPCG